MDSNIFSSFGSEIMISIATAIFSLIGGYIIIRERILKSELKIESMTNYIDRKNDITNNQIMDLQSDIKEFKETNKEISKSLTENTVAIRELGAVLNLLKDQLGVKAMRKIKNSISEND